MKEKIAVIGGGIVGRIVALELDKNKYDVELFDLQNDPRNLKFHRDIQGPSSVWVKGSRVFGIPGGQLVWGNKSSYCAFLLSKAWPEDFIQNLDNYGNKLQQYGFPKLDFIKLPTKGISNFLVKESYKFDSRLPYFIDKFDSRITWVEGLVEKIDIISSNNFKLVFKNSLQSSGTYKNIILCCGSIGNQEILAMSGLQLNIVENVFDHPNLTIQKFTSEYPFLAKKGMFSFNRIQRKNEMKVFYFFDSISKISYSIRIAPKNSITAIDVLKKYILKRSSKNISSLHALLLIIWSAITGRIMIFGLEATIAIDFMGDSPLKPGSFSDDGKVDFIDFTKDVLIPSEAFYFIRKFFPTQGGGNLEVILKERLMTPNNAQCGIHLMGTTPVKNDPLINEINQSFALHGKNGIFVCGASVFPESVPGHPTMLAAATGIHVSRLINNRNITLK